MRLYWLNHGIGMLGAMGAAQATTPAQLTVAQMVVDAANKYGVPPQLALGIASHESGFDPNAVNPNGGAAGVMQLIPSTAAGLNVTNPLDAQQNIDGGVSLLATLLKKYNGDPTLALWAYSNGPGSVTAGGANPANMPAQAAGLVSYVEGYQVPLGVELGGSGSIPADVNVNIPTVDSTGNIVDQSGAGTGADLSNAIDTSGIMGVDSSTGILSGQTAMIIGAGLLGLMLLTTFARKR